MSLEDTLALCHFRHSQMLRDKYVQQLTELLLLSRERHVHTGGPAWQFAPLYHRLHSAWSGAKKDLAGESPESQGEMLDTMLTSSVLRIWGLTKSVYHFHPSVARMLLSASHGDIPHEALYNLPQWCVYVHIPEGMLSYTPARGGAEVDVCGFYAMLDAQPPGAEFRKGTLDAAGKIERVGHLLHLVVDRKRKAPYDVAGELTRMSIPLAGTIRESVEMMAHGQDTVTEDEREGMIDLISRLVGPVLYLSARNREIVGEPRNPDRVRFEPPQKRGRRRSLARRPPVQVWQVAWRTGAALEANEQQAVENVPTGATVKPHVRRAHFHSYWCGPGRERCEVRWLGPVFVNSSLAEDERRTVTSHES
jgi:hypothetical protein